MRVLNYLTLFLVIQSAFAAEFEANQLKLNYKNNSGTLASEAIKIDTSSFSFNAPTLEALIDLSEDQLIIQTAPGTYKIKAESIVKFFKESRELKLNLREALVHGHETYLNIPYANIVQEDRYETTKLEFYCGGESKSEFVFILDQCIDYGEFTIKEFNLLTPLIREEMVLTKLSNFFMAIDSGNVILTVRIDDAVQVKVKIKGTLEHLVDSKLARFHLKSAKAGFLNVKRKILEKLKESESEDFWLEDDNIYLRLK